MSNIFVCRVGLSFFPANVEGRSTKLRLFLKFKKNDEDSFQTENSALMLHPDVAFSVKQAFGHSHYKVKSQKWII